MSLNNTSRTSSVVERCWLNICYISDIRTTRPALCWIAKFFRKRFSHSWLDGKNQENYDSFTVIQDLEFPLDNYCWKKTPRYSNLLMRWKIFFAWLLNFVIKWVDHLIMEVKLAMNIEIVVKLWMFISSFAIWIGQIQSKWLNGLVTNGMDGM